MSVELETIVPEPQQIDILYRLLGERKHFISHCTLPGYKQHTEFVNNHPYRKWFLVLVNQEYTGSIYVGNDNSIGINNLESLEFSAFQQVLTLLLQSVEPLSAVTSVRPQSFFFNVAPTNESLMKKLELTGYRVIQVTYSS